MPKDNVLVCQLDTNRNGLGGVSVEDCLDLAGLWACWGWSACLACLNWLNWENPTWKCVTGLGPGLPMDGDRQLRLSTHARMHTHARTFSPLLTVMRRAASSSRCLYFPVTMCSRIVWANKSSLLWVVFLSKCAMMATGNWPRTETSSRRSP